MYAVSLLSLLDDIATGLDDVALMSKVAAKQTAGVLGDDLALNAQQVAGVNPERELPVVWAVAKGSLINKAILVPGALAISLTIPWAITPLLMAGGAFLCYEGVEKLAHKFVRSPEEHATHDAELAEALADPAVDLVALEKEKIKGAIRTDFILSAEIVVITLGIVAAMPLMQRAMVLATIALAMTVAVYGIVAGIVKLDDLGLRLSRRPRALARGLGSFLMAAAPKLMKALTIIGTIAMFMVGGGILSHGIAALHHLSESAAEAARAIPGAGGVLGVVTPLLISIVAGVIVGIIALVVVKLATRLLPRRAKA
jgi:predicted DNA repair protein MutK